MAKQINDMGINKVGKSTARGFCQYFLTLETGISANFDVRRNVVPPWRVRQAHSGSNSPMTSQNVNAKQSRKVASCVRLRHILHTLDKNEKNNQTPH